MLKGLFNGLFNRKGKSAHRTVASGDWEQSLLEQVRTMAPNDPLIGAKVGGKELARRMVEVMGVDGRVHVESLMCAVGALAGYGCQMAARSANVAAGNNELANFAIATTKNGERLFFGDPINKFLAENEMSVWSVAAGGAKALGCTQFPDLGLIFKHVATSAGTDAFGVPRLPVGHPVHALPLDYLRKLWPAFSGMVDRFAPRPEHRPLLFGLAIQNLLSQTKEILEPGVSLQIVMESAIPMSKIDLGTV